VIKSGMLHLTASPVEHQQARGIARFDRRLGDPFRRQYIIKIGSLQEIKTGLFIQEADDQVQPDGQQQRYQDRGC
jgi:hypothetical protein